MQEEVTLARQHTLALPPFFSGPQMRWSQAPLVTASSLLICWLKCYSFPETTSQALSQAVFYQQSGHPLAFMLTHKINITNGYAIICTLLSSWPAFSYLINPAVSVHRYIQIWSFISIQLHYSGALAIMSLLDDYKRLLTNISVWGFVFLFSIAHAAIRMIWLKRKSCVTPLLRNVLLFPILLQGKGKFIPRPNSFCILHFTPHTCRFSDICFLVSLQVYSVSHTASLLFLQHVHSPLYLDYSTPTPCPLTPSLTSSWSLFNINFQ
jgi:hypothetical protein